LPKWTIQNVDDQFFDVLLTVQTSNSFDERILVVNIDVFHFDVLEDGALVSLRRQGDMVVVDRMRLG
jgi:CHASE2 domain-containing sensor protein